MTLAEATRQYQVTLEHYRRDPEEYEQELEQSKAVMETAWCELLLGESRAG